jgi:predicted dehydrogenase
VILAIFGGGSIGQRHAANARTLGHQVHVYDTDPLKGGDPNRFVPGIVQAVLICTPASTHARLAEQLLAKGYRGPLFVEKPLATKSDVPIFQAWPHPTTMVGYNWRFFSEIAPLQYFARRGTAFHFVCHTDMRTWPGHTYGDPMLECSHEIDLAQCWMGEPEQITGGTLDADAGAWVQMTHARGESIVDVRWFSPPRRRITVIQPGAIGFRTTVRADISTTGAFHESYVAELLEFLAAVKHERASACPFPDGLRVVQICERVQKLAVA